MNRHDLDRLTEKEKRQLGAWINWSNGMEYEAQQNRKKISEARTKEELGIESEVENEFESETT